MRLDSVSWCLVSDFVAAAADVVAAVVAIVEASVTRSVALVIGVAEVSLRVEVERSATERDGSVGATTLNRSEVAEVDSNSDSKEVDPSSVVSVFFERSSS